MNALTNLFSLFFLSSFKKPFVMTQIVKLYFAFTSHIATSELLRHIEEEILFIYLQLLLREETCFASSYFQLFFSIINESSESFED
jgi:hypothetical protein